jgi:hypothetical protein
MSAHTLSIVFAAIGVGMIAVAFVIRKLNP